MTNKEAIAILKPLFEQCKGTNECLGYIEHYFSKDEELALDLAIHALEERPQGEWKETGYETGALGITYRQTQCSNCSWEHALPMWLNFCPNCGAKMRGEKDDK